MAKDESSKKAAGKKLLTLVIALAVLGLLAGSGYYIRTLRKQRTDLRSQNADLTKQIGVFKADPNAAGQAEANKTIAEVGKLYALPKDENPSVATVKDKTKLTDQPFFAKAENGDITLIYSTAKLAILYRPSTKQIINVSSVTIQDKPAAPAPATP